MATELETGTKTDGLAGSAVRKAGVDADSFDLDASLAKMDLGKLAAIAGNEQTVVNHPVFYNCFDNAFKNKPWSKLVPR